MGSATIRRQRQLLRDASTVAEHAAILRQQAGKGDIADESKHADGGIVKRY
jgi:hypothetical protein